MFKENRFIFRGKKGLETGDVPGSVKAGTGGAEGLGGKVKEGDGKSLRRKMRKEISGSVAEDLGGRDADVYKKSLDAMETTGLGREKCREILEDGTNPFSVWLMDFVERMPGNGWEFDLGATKKQKKLMFRRVGEKTAQSINNAELIFKWEDTICPNLERLIGKWGGKYRYGDYENAVWKVVVDLTNYSGVRTWLGLATFIRSTDESLELRAMIELGRAAGIGTSSLEGELAKREERKRVENERVSGVSEKVGVSRVSDVRYEDEKKQGGIDEIVERNFGSELEAYQDGWGRIMGSEKISPDEFEDFRHCFEDLIDKIAKKNSFLTEANDSLKKLMLDFEDMAASGYTRDEAMKYAKEIYKGGEYDFLREAYKKAEENGDYTMIGFVDLYGVLCQSFTDIVTKFYNQ